MFASNGETTAPCGVPFVTACRTPSSTTPAFSHLRIRRNTRRSPIRCSANRIIHSWLMLSKHAPRLDREEPFDIGVQYPVHCPVLDACRERVQRIVLSPPGPEPIGEAEEVRLVDGIENLHHRTLDNLIFQRGDAERALPSVRFRDVDTS